MSDSLPLVASWINVFLYTFELVLCGKYLRRSRPLVNKIGVGIMVLADTVSTVATCVNVQLALVDFPLGTSLDDTHKRLAATIIATYTTALVEQFFMCRVYFLLTGNVPVTGILVLAALIHTGFSFASAILLFSSIPAATVTTTVGAVSCAVTDVLITSCLCLKVWQMQRSTSPDTETRSLVQRVMFLTISSGATVASNTLIMAILLIRYSPVYQLFFTCQGRVYALSLLGGFLLGTPFSPNSSVATNPTAHVGTAVLFRVADPDNASLEVSLAPRRGRPSPVVLPDSSSKYGSEERIDLKTIPTSLSQQPARS